MGATASRVVEGMSERFREFGERQSPKRRAKRTVAVSLALVVVLSAGMALMESEDDTEYLFTPKDSQGELVGERVVAKV